MIELFYLPGNLVNPLSNYQLLMIAFCPFSFHLLVCIWHALWYSNDDNWIINISLVLCVLLFGIVIMCRRRNWFLLLSDLVLLNEIGDCMDVRGYSSPTTNSSKNIHVINCVLCCHHLTSSNHVFLHWYYGSRTDLLLVLTVIHHIC